MIADLGHCLGTGYLGLSHRFISTLGLLNISLPWQINAHEEAAIISWRVYWLLTRIIQQPQCSMSRKGNCWHHAVGERVLGTLKREWTHDRSFRTRQEAKAAEIEYIEMLYNSHRRHFTLGSSAPMSLMPRRGRL